MVERLIDKNPTFERMNRHVYKTDKKKKQVNPTTLSSSLSILRAVDCLRARLLYLS